MRNVVKTLNGKCNDHFVKTRIDVRIVAGDLAGRQGVRGISSKGRRCDCSLVKTPSR